MEPAPIVSLTKASGTRGVPPTPPRIPPLLSKRFQHWTVLTGRKRGNGFTGGGAEVVNVVDGNGKEKDGGGVATTLPALPGSATSDRGTIPPIHTTTHPRVRRTRRSTAGSGRVESAGSGGGSREDDSGTSNTSNNNNNNNTPTSARPDRERDHSPDTSHSRSANHKHHHHRHPPKNPPPPPKPYLPFPLAPTSTYNPSTLTPRKLRALDPTTKAKYSAYDMPRGSIVREVEASAGRSAWWRREERRRWEEWVEERSGGVRRGVGFDGVEGARRARERMREKVRRGKISRDQELQFLVEGQRNAIDAIRLKEYLATPPLAHRLGRIYTEKDRLRVEELLAG